MTPPRIAILSSGLGRVHRGNETWALQLAEDLRALDCEVTLYSGGRVEAAVPTRVVANLPRGTPVLRKLLPWGRRYLLEQVTFAAAFRRAWRGQCDIVHTADPNLAQQLLRHAAAEGYQLIYKDGLGIGARWCAKFPWVQVLAPYYKEVAARAGQEVSRWHVIPHYVRPPAPDGAGRELRAHWLGSAAGEWTVVLGVGDFSPESAKRLDWIVRETAAVERPVFLVLAGQATRGDLRRLGRLAQAYLPGRHRLLPNVPRARMGAIYQAADLLVHAALREPFGLVLIEAMSYGLPAIVHRFPVTQWIVGEAGVAIDMTRPGELASALERTIGQLEELRAAARRQVEQQFSRERVLPLYLELYRRAAGR